MRRCVLILLGLILGLSPSNLRANDASKELGARASDLLYNLDLERAAVTFREAISADPADASAHRGLASVLWAQVAFDRGTLTIDSLIGRVTTTPVKITPPPQAIVSEFQRSIDKAVSLAHARSERRADDVDALYEYGAAIGLRASYAATIDGTVMAAFRSARSAFDAHERVLALDPSRRDAGLTVGMYRYLVAAMSLPLRWVAYVAGFGGNATRGLRLVEGAANYAGDSQTDARLALVLLYNRERRFDDALAQLSALRARYPSNRLFWLEAGATALRANRASDAERLLTEGIDRFSKDDRRKMQGEAALWFYKRGAARAAQGRDHDAEVDLRHALSVDGRDWVRGRSHFELGKLALKSGRQAQARDLLRQASLLCDRDQDGSTAAEARKLMNR